jgi:hypothetical protein
MRIVSSCIIAMSFLFMMSYCKSKEDKPLSDGKVESASEAKEVADNIQEAQSASVDRWEARKAKGDTLAMPYKDLQNYLPDVSGYTKEGGPKGSQVNMPGMGSWSQAEQHYVNGDKNIDVQIVDYNSAQTALAGATAVYKMGYSAEDDTKKQGSTDLGIKDVSAYETIYKDGSRAQLAIIVADRFFINIDTEGDNSSDLIRSVAKNMKLEELASK